jgi:hypothetical protein
MVMTMEATKTPIVVPTQVKKFSSIDEVIEGIVNSITRFSRFTTTDAEIIRKFDESIEDSNLKKAIAMPNWAKLHQLHLRVCAKVKSRLQKESDSYHESIALRPVDR